MSGTDAQEIERRVKNWLRAQIGPIRGTHENLSTANLEVRSLNELRTQVGIGAPDAS